VSWWDESNDVAAESQDGSLFRVHSDSVAEPGWPDNLSSDRILIAPGRSVLASSTLRGSLPPCLSSSRASFGSASGCLLASCKAGSWRIFLAVLLAVAFLFALRRAVRDFG